MTPDTDTDGIPEEVDESCFTEDGEYHGLDDKGMADLLVAIRKLPTKAVQP